MPGEFVEQLIRLVFQHGIRQAGVLNDLVLDRAYRAGDLGDAVCA
jgi:hypothetical protein